MIISLSGTPGTGKSTVGRRLAGELGYSVIELSNFIKSGSEFESRVSLGRINGLANSKMKENSIIISHLAHLLTSNKIDLFIVLRCNPAELIKRLKKRGYSDFKVYDNAMFEALDGTYIEAAELHKNVVQIENTKNLRSTVKRIVSLVENGKKPKKFNKDYSKYLLKIERQFRSGLKYTDCGTIK